MTRGMDVVWRALSDPSRRRLLSLLKDGPRTTGDLSDRFKTTRFAVMKHLGVLEDAGLIAIERRGRERWNHLNPTPLRRIYEEFVDPHAGAWAAGLLRLEHLVGTPPEGTPMGTQASPKLKQADFGVAEALVETTIAAAPERVWKTMFEGGGTWWPLDFVTSPKTKKFVIEPGLAGKWYEDFGAHAGVLWFTTVLWEPPTKVAVTGVSIPGCGGGGPFVSNVVFTLEPDGKGTRVRISDQSLGRIDDATRQSLSEGWAQLLGVLKQMVEKE
jgi:DNA-binding transcriptional ArsR family regulator/uncharacterized protein YndB with AHSA1/START domain